MYDQLHELVGTAVMERRVFDQGFLPSLIVCIGAGGFFPSRVLRTFLKQKLGYNLQIHNIGLVLYEDVEGFDPEHATVRKTQWLEPDMVELSGQSILIVDEVDDSRKTLSFAVSEMYKTIDEHRARHEAAGKPWEEPRLGVFVLHNKQKPKKASLPARFKSAYYFCGAEIAPHWCVYPWDAVDTYEHTRLAEQASHSQNQNSAPRPVQQQQQQLQLPTHVLQARLVNSNGGQLGCSPTFSVGLASA